MLVLLALWKQADPWDLLASQPGQLGEFQDNERPYHTHTPKQVALKEWHTRLSSDLHIRTPVHLNMYTQRETHMDPGYIHPSVLCPTPTDSKFPFNHYFTGTGWVQNNTYSG